MLNRKINFDQENKKMWWPTVTGLRLFLVGCQA